MTKKDVGSVICSADASKINHALMPIRPRQGYARLLQNNPIFLSDA
jgi:hypothetical protein